MKILFLGTGAADWSQERDGKEFRRNSSALIDGCLLIDPGPGVIDAINEYSVDISMIKYILNTHRHEDHFNNDTLEILKTNGVEVFDFEEEEQKNIGKYKIKAVKANHPVPTLHYIISDGKSRIFYGLDGAWLMYNEVQAIKEEKVDFAIFDATIGFIDGDYRIFEHNNLNMVLEMKKTLLPYIDRFCISHMARTLHDEHKVLEEQMRKHDVEVAFDGMEIVI